MFYGTKTLPDQKVVHNLLTLKQSSAFISSTCGFSQVLIMLQRTYEKSQSVYQMFWKRPWKWCWHFFLWLIILLKMVLTNGVDIYIYIIYIYIYIYTFTIHCILYYIMYYVLYYTVYTIFYYYNTLYYLRFVVAIAFNI